MKSCLTIVLLFLCNHAFAFESKVIHISDGDTVTVMNAKKQKIKIRLAHIDAPENDQPFGKKSKQYLSRLIKGQNVRLNCHTTDHYGRKVCGIYHNQLDVDAEMIRAGLAWVYRKYNKRPELIQIEKNAKKNRVGLWASKEADIIEPEQWRKHRNLQLAVNQAQSNSSKTSLSKCGTKRYCKQMASCKEAYYFLNKCGLNRLDGDKDGIPCESLCR